METQEMQFPYTSLTKTELAQLYLPEFTAAVARRKLNAWIARNRQLTDCLQRTGYSSRLHLLTPAQVKCIVHYLGEP